MNDSRSSYPINNIPGYQYYNMEEQESGLKTKKVKTPTQNSKKYIVDDDIAAKGSYKGNIKNTYINKINSLVAEGKSPLEDEYIII